MEDRKLLDAHEFNRRQEIAKPIIASLFLHGFLRFLFLFNLLYILGVKKHTLFNKFLQQKKTLNMTGRRRCRLQGEQGHDFLYVISLTYIIH